MKCPECGGVGRIHYGEEWCSACNGTGEQQTNEEWIKSLKTEELAEFLADKCNEVVDTVLSDASCNIDDADQDDYWYRKTDFVEWLKEIHKDS